MKSREAKGFRPCVRESGRYFLRCGKLYVFVLISSVICAVGALVSFAQSDRPLPDSITVVADDNYPPYIFRDASGELRGILPDEWKLWEQKTGVRVNLRAMDWGVAQEVMQGGKADVIDTIFSNAVRAAIYEFTPSYADIVVPVFSHKSLGGITDITSLRGFTVGVKTGDACIDVLKAGGITDFREYPSYEAIIRAAAAGEIRVFSVDEPPAMYYLYKLGLAEEFRLCFTLNTGAFHRAVGKGNIEMLRLVEGGFGQITEKERHAIRNRWMGAPVGHPAYIKPLIYTLLGVAGACAVLLIFNILLRRKVAQKVSEAEKAAAEKKESEETFRSIIQNSPMGIYLYRLETDNRLVFFGANPAADRMIGVNHSAFIGRTIEDIFPPLAKTEIPERYRRAARFGESWHTELVDYNYGGISGAFEVYAFQIAEGETAVMFNEITARKQAEEERERLQDQLAQAQKMESVGRLAGGVAHDFNNMLGVILGYAELAMEEIDASHPLYDELREIRKAADRSADLTRQLLAFARKQPIQPRLLDINATVEGLLKMLKRLIGENVELVWRPCGDLPPVLMDGSQIDHMLTNLCLNARDSIAGTGKITITTGLAKPGGDDLAAHPECSAGDYVQLTVSDTGCGMDQKTLARLFEPFFTTKEMGKGTGLGLATVYGIVRQNRGFINVDSQPGQGTEFRICLPVVGGEAAHRSAAGGAAMQAAGGAAVLLVEDESSILKLGGRMLRRLGYKVLEAESAGKALRVAREYEGKIDLLITDLVMPGMNGRDLADQIRKMMPETRVLFTSGYTAGTLDGEASMSADEINFLPKPFSMKTLSARIRETLDRPAGDAP